MACLHNRNNSLVHIIMVHTQNLNMQSSNRLAEDGGRQGERYAGGRRRGDAVLRAPCRHDTARAGKRMGEVRIVDSRSIVLKQMRVAEVTGQSRRKQRALPRQAPSRNARRPSESRTYT